jgi:hypothetical protein
MKMNDDSFSCANCHTTFTPDKFRFNYNLHVGAMGAGSEWREVLNTPCPKCKTVFPASFFTTCNVCKKGAAKTSSACAIVGSSHEIYHFGCLSKLIPPISRERAGRVVTSDQGKVRCEQPAPPSSGIPDWVWIVGIGIVLLFMLLTSR